jgi:very-short-patch-repair endonuclease
MAPRDPTKRDTGVDAAQPRHVSSEYAPQRDARSGGRGDCHVSSADIAARQRGLVTRRQLLEVGLASTTIAAWIADERLHRMYRGVYLVGHPVPPPLARELGAVLAFGRGAALSHRPAAVVLGLLPPAEAPMHVTLTRHARSHSGIRVHRTQSLDMGTCDGIPVTSPTQTLYDIARTAGARDLEQAVNEALVQDLVVPEAIRGSPRIRRLLELQAGPGVTKREAEERMKELIRAAKLPMGIANTRLAGWQVDRYWPDRRAAVEVDSFKFHGKTPRQFRNDHEKTAALEREGIRLIRVTWWQIVEEPLALAARLARLLA